MGRTIHYQLTNIYQAKEAFKSTEDYKFTEYHFLDPYDTQAWTDFAMKMFNLQLKPTSSTRPTENSSEINKKKTEQELHFLALLNKAKASPSKAPAGTIDKNKTALEKQIASIMNRRNVKINIPMTLAARKELVAKDAEVLIDGSAIEKIDETSKPTDYIEKEKTLIFDESQELALKGLLDHQYACIIGAAGTGKTTITNRFLAKITDEFIQKYNREPEIILCSFTGRASRNLALHVPMHLRKFCRTIHAHLEYKPVGIVDINSGETKRLFVPHRTETNPLTADIIIIDEAGNVQVWLWNNLVKATLPKTKVYQLGDINQLPPVNGKSVLGYAMQQWPTFELTKIHRQALDNPIIAGAHNILQGYIPDTHPNNFVMVNLPDDEHEAYTKVLKIIKTLHKQGSFDPFRDALIVPQNVGILGQEHLNDHFVSYFNPAKGERIIISAAFKHIALAVNDKLMLTQNDNERGLTNGMIGRVIKIKPNELYSSVRDKIKFDPRSAIDFNELMATLNSAEFAQDVNNAFDKRNKDLEEGKNSDFAEKAQRQASHIVTVRFEDQDVEFRTVGSFNQLMHAYAATCHKCQGGEFPLVVIVCHTENDRMLYREWLYTAVTRAIDKVILLSNKRGLLNALSRQRIKGLSLEQKAKSFMDLQDKEDHLVPKWPDASQDERNERE